MKNAVMLNANIANQESLDSLNNIKLTNLEISLQDQEVLIEEHCQVRMLSVTIIHKW